LLKVRIIPTLLWKDVGLVKGVAFNSWRRVGSVLPALKVYTMRDVDELILVDITASKAQRAPDHEAVADFSDECFVPLTVGGGITELQHIVNLLHSGADKICVNTGALADPDLIDRAAARFGTQCVVTSIDARRGADGTYTVFADAGMRDTGLEPTTWAAEAADRGAGEILLTSIDRDGTLQGYDLELVASVASRVDVPVIASGGAGTYSHMIEVITQAGASAVAAASMFHFTEQTPSGAKQALADAGIPVRRNFLAA
jgi:cyclase